MPQRVRRCRTKDTMQRRTSIECETEQSNTDDAHWVDNNNARQWRWLETMMERRLHQSGRRRRAGNDIYNTISRYHSIKTFLNEFLIPLE